MAPSRREFVKRASAGAAVLLIGERSRWPLDAGAESSAGDPRLRQIVLDAIDAARAAGASYADARVTRIRNDSLGLDRIRDVQTFELSTFKQYWGDEEFAVGVRALVGGAWGFAATRQVSSDAAARVARAAVGQARANAWDASSSSEFLAPMDPARSDGEWMTPIKRDPFDVSPEEKFEAMRVVGEAGIVIPDVRQVGNSISSRREDITFASTESAVLSQTLHVASPGCSVSVFKREAPLDSGANAVAQLIPSGLGYEAYSEAGLVKQVPSLIEEARRLLRLVEKEVPVTVGRYDLVFDAAMMASIMANSIGGATELDRALGYEANADGTSYLAPPERMLGAFRLGPEFLNVRADRSQPKSLARVRWDDEGVEPEDFMLIRNGVVNDYQTTRDLAPWLRAWYRRQGVPLRSHGCSASESAFYAPIQHRPNISLLPGKQDVSFDDLVRSTKKGLAFLGGGGFTDQQFLTWQLISNDIYEIRNGKLGARVRGAAVLTRAPELWKSLEAVGGPRSYRSFASGSGKGQPGQSRPNWIGAVPGKFRGASVVNSGEKK